MPSYYTNAPDIHKDSIDIAVADAGRKGGLRHVDTIRGDLDALDKVLRIRG